MLFVRELAALVSPRTWLALISHFTGLFTGFVAIFIVAFGVAFGFGFAPLALVGLPLLGFSLRFATWFGHAERTRLAVMLGARIPEWPAAARGGGPRAGKTPRARGPGAGPPGRRR